jgi:hypothetical protein
VKRATFICLRCHNIVAYRVHHQVTYRVKFEFVHYAVPVDLSGADADTESASDQFIRIASGEEKKNFPFASCKLWFDVTLQYPSLLPVRAITGERGQRFPKRLRNPLKSIALEFVKRF